MKSLTNENISLKVVEELRQMNIDILSLSLLKPVLQIMKQLRLLRKRKELSLLLIRTLEDLFFRL